VSRYLVLDGPDGAGKSTQARALCEWLRAAGRTVLHLREPGSTPLGEALRTLLLQPGTGELRPLTEALLFTAARAELVAQVIAPALAQGQVVVAERCYLSTLAYQGLAARPGVDRELLLELTRQAHGDCLPHAVFVLDVPAAVAAARRQARAGDRIELRGIDYHARVRAAFLEVARHEPAAQIVDASGSSSAVQQQLRARVQELLR